MLDWNSALVLRCRSKIFNLIINFKLKDNIHKVQKFDLCPYITKYQGPLSVIDLKIYFQVMFDVCEKCTVIVIGLEPATKWCESPQNVVGFTHRIIYVKILSRSGVVMTQLPDAGSYLKILKAS